MKVTKNRPFDLLRSEPLLNSVVYECSAVCLQLVALPSTEQFYTEFWSGRREKGAMGAEHRRGRRDPRDRSEVSCCIKYLLFSFNVFFWVSFAVPNVLVDLSSSCG